MTIEENKALSARENHPFVFKVNGERFYPGTGAKLSYRSAGIDTAQFSCLPPGLVKPGDMVEVFYNDSRVFAGSAEKIINLQGSGKERTETVLCHGPWGRLNRYVYRQEWCAGRKDGSSITFSSSRVILNQSAVGVPITMQEQLNEIATYAKDVCGFGLGDISASEIYLPLDETRDITCASAIQRTLRFFPKKVVYFDYSQTKPALNIADPDTSGDSAYIADIPKSQRSYEYTAHPIVCVDISTQSVEIETSSDGTNDILRGLTHQTYPENADTEDIDCLKVFIPLQGASAGTSWESFESVTEDIPADLNNVDWWKAKHPRLANVENGEIEIRSAFRTDSNGFPRLAAATSDQLAAAGCSSEISRFTCTCKITTAEDVEDNITLTMDFLTTDATTRTYTWQTGSSYIEGESLPEGLAKAIFEQRSGSLLNEDISIRLGDTFPCLGDTADGLILQSFDVDCADLSASLHFGHPEHLSVEDMRDLLNGFRQRASASNAVLRSAESPEEDAEEQGTIQPIGSTEFSPGKKSMTVLGEKDGEGSITLTADSDNTKLEISEGQKSIVLDVADFPDDCDGNIGIHEFKYKDKEGEEQVYHGLFCDDIDLTDTGKTIKDVSVEAQGGEPSGTKITFKYTDKTEDTFVISNGLKGRDGDPGEAGVPPTITAEKSFDITNIYADGELLATLKDGATPEISADKNGKTTTIYANGLPIAQIEDGRDAGEGDDGTGDEGDTQSSSIDCITGIRFEISDGKLKCMLTRKTFRVSHTAENHPVETEDAETVEICDAKEVEVVTSESYSSSTHQFTNTRRKITVLGDAAATGETPFTATPLSGE